MSAAVVSLEAHRARMLRGTVDGLLADLRAHATPEWAAEVLSALADVLDARERLGCALGDTREEELTATRARAEELRGHARAMTEVAS